MTALSNRILFNLPTPTSRASRKHRLKMYKSDALIAGFNLTPITGSLDTTASSATWTLIDTSSTLLTIGTPTTDTVSTEALLTASSTMTGPALVKVTVTFASGEIVSGYLIVDIMEDPRSYTVGDYDD